MLTRNRNRSVDRSADCSASPRPSAGQRTRRRRLLLAAASLPAASLSVASLPAPGLTAAALTAAALTAAPRPARAQASGALTIAAASDLKFALEEIAPLFERASGERLRLVFGSSGTFYAQIRQGAPFQVFMSADEDFVLRLAEAGRARDRGRLYAIGRIGIIVPKGSPLRADGTLGDLALALRDGRLRRFAIANPEHAPYGARAREALRHRGLWDAIEPRLVLGENISQATQFALSGSAQGGITAVSLARAPEVARKSDFALLPGEWHAPLRQRMVALTDSPPSAQAFCEFMTSGPIVEIMARHGFERATGP